MSENKNKLRVNYISTDKQSAISSYGETFEVGEKVGHQDTEAGQATIVSFRASEEENEVVVNTDKGHTHLDFLVKL